MMDFFLHPTIDPLAKKTVIAKVRVGLCLTFAKGAKCFRTLRP